MSKQTKADKIAASAPINQRALLTRRMAADYLSIGLPLFDQYRSSKDIVGIPIASGKEERYRRSDLDDLIEALAAGTTNIDRAKAS